jgi:hypothetical protein
MTIRETLLAALTSHDWDKVRDALFALQEYTQEHEHHAVNLLNALEYVLASLPENE